MLGIVEQQAKIDTGATTSSLDATDITLFEKNGEQWVGFMAHLGVPSTMELYCEAPFVSSKWITSSNGQAQRRYVISTRLTLGSDSWVSHFTLSNRQNMKYRLLIGANTLIEGGLIVNPALSYTQPKSPLT